MPNAHRLAEPLPFADAYIWGTLGGVLVFNWLMRWMKRRNPRMTTFRLVWRTFLVVAVVDLVAEVVFVRTGYYVFVATVRHLTLFPDSYYRFPVYEAVLWGGAWTAMACVRHFKNDKGQCVAERGSSRPRSVRTVDASQLERYFLMLACPSASGFYRRAS